MAHVMLKSVIGNIVVAAFFLLFVYANVKGFNATGDLSYIFVAINEGIYITFYLIRQRAIATSTSAFDWSVAFSATFIGTLLRPAHPVSVFLGSALIIIGLMVNTISVLYLNRSLSLVPAERSLKTRGPYRFIRHPMYSSEIIGFFGYMLVNFSSANIVIVISNTALMLMRINREEHFLSRNDLYRKYLERTPWRLLPFVY